MSDSGILPPDPRWSDWMRRARTEGWKRYAPWGRPLPVSGRRPQKGICQWCGYPAEDAYHSNCEDEYGAYVRETSLWRQKLALTEMDGAFCSACGGDGPLEMDHIEPLCLSRDNPWFWGIWNLQFLCVACHRQKSKEDRRDCRKHRRTIAAQRDQAFRVACEAVGVPATPALRREVEEILAGG